ncbi:MAG TPA: hypothetical protein VL948_02655 [Verrucomicrobiae bacterium]|jgi:hypothetical protein|nr:hypothetical protein [Verrucomicrobiae bacterium]
MKTMIGMALVAVPMVMVASGDFSAATVAMAGLVAGGCWMISGWFTE